MWTSNNHWHVCFFWFFLKTVTPMPWRDGLRREELSFISLQIFLNILRVEIYCLHTSFTPKVQSFLLNFMAKLHNRLNSPSFFIWGKKACTVFLSSKQVHGLFLNKNTTHGLVFSTRNLVPKVSQFGVRKKHNPGNPDFQDFNDGPTVVVLYIL